MAGEFSLSLEEILRKIPSYPEELGLNLRRAEDRFKWFLASILFAKRISSDIAKRTYRCFEAEGLTRPERILEAGWDRLVQVLDEGGYVRYDFSTASNLLSIMRFLKEHYGSLEELYSMARDPEDLEARLQEFKGVGPVAVNIFLRELRDVWPKARPKPSPIALKIASQLGLSNIEPFESALVRLALEFCKRKRCSTCPVVGYCSAKIMPR
jgi:endonuclease III